MDPRELKRRVVKWCDVGRCPLDARSSMIDHYDGKWTETVFRDIDDDIYIMMSVCLFVCNEKSSLPPGSLL